MGSKTTKLILLDSLLQEIKTDPEWGLNLIPPKSKSSSSEQWVVKLDPLLPWPPRLVHWVFLLRRLARILPNPLKSGKVLKLPSSSQFRTDRPRLLLSHLRPL